MTTVFIIEPHVSNSFSYECNQNVIYIKLDYGFSLKCIQAENGTGDTACGLTRTGEARRRRVKGAVGVAGRAVELQATPLRALHRLGGAVTDGPLGQETRVVVVDEVAEDAAIRERHGEVFHLHTDGQHTSFTVVFFKFLRPINEDF